MNRVLIFTKDHAMMHRFSSCLEKESSLTYKIIKSNTRFIKEFNDFSPDVCVLHDDFTETVPVWLNDLKHRINGNTTPVIFLAEKGSFDQLPWEFNPPLVEVLPSTIQEKILIERILHLIHLTKKEHFKEVYHDNHQNLKIIQQLVTEISENLKLHGGLGKENQSYPGPTNLTDTKDRLLELQNLLSAEIPVSQQTKEDLFLSKKFYRQIFESVQDGVVLYDAESFRLIDLNKKAHSDLGYSREEFFKLKPEDFTIYKNKDQRAQVLSELMNTGSVKYQVRHKQKDGFLRTRVMHAKLLFFDHKKYILGILQDVSELVAKEELIYSKENKIKELEENT
jgi:PAS domain S-box-containing protein